MKEFSKNFKIFIIKKKNQIRHRYLDDFFFVRINKTGGSSIKWALHLPIGHTTAQEYIQQFGQDEWNRRFSFTVVRNPWDRVVSQYFYRIQTNQNNLLDEEIDFKTWVKLTYGEQDPRYLDDPKLFMPQVDWISDQEGNILIDFVLRFENLQKNFSILCDKLGKDLDLPHIKASDRERYQKYYDQETVRVVEKWFRKDISTFQYSYK